ncbi:gas vesicle structural protein GvpA [Streptomyces tubbatahanensis]|uniref:Gas vesicle protein A n=1 Tax=Streptomyces tubbatahanensis TaxID=2923272 RepID=A0ABY3XN23_9ACTN|nr:gas vesicle protein GvpJ [Streptomyces tubbatahanensis]UNS95848.1 gas vesicle structural protein GvpA [Streptomyces tubbatahanensis]
MTTTTYNEAAVCVPRAGTLYDVLELILDRGMVIDIFVRVSLVGIEILKIDARIVVASVDTYLRFAEVCNRLDLNQDASSRTVPDLFAGMAGGVAKGGAKKAAKSVGGKVKDAIGMGDEDDDVEREDYEAPDEEEPDEEEPEEAPRARRGSGSRTASASRAGTRATRRAQEA